MDLNLTLIVQMFVFIAFVWFTMKFVWPPLAKAMEERQAKIADGLSAAERGRRELELAQHQCTLMLQQSKAEASEILSKANHQATILLEEGKKQSQKEREHQLALMAQQIDQQLYTAKQSLQKEVSRLAIAVSEAILKMKIDEKTHGDLLADLIKEI